MEWNEISLKMTSILFAGLVGLQEVLTLSYISSIHISPDHMLSYFLSDQGGHGGGLNSPPRVSFATTTTSSRSSSSDSNNNHPGGGISLLGFGRDSASKHGNGEGGEDDGIPAAAAPPPPTPVTQYYYHHAQHANSSSGKAPPPQAGSSGYGASHIHIGGNGGSMATIAEALVNPPTIPPASTSSSSSSLLNRTGSNGDSISNMDGLSPISPASMMMHGSAAQHQEPMLLPNTDIPPSNDARTVDPSQNSYPSVDRRSHLSWLQEINALAKANQQQQQQIHSSTMPSQPQNPFGIGMPSTPAAAGIQAPPYIPPHHAILMSPTLLAAAESAPAVESEEKRAKRLERNRESARKSRRRKKERLSQLEEQVSDLHSQLEYQRRIQLNAMDDLLLQFQQERIQNLSQKQQQYELQDHHSIETSMQLELELDILVAMTGPNCPVRRAVVDFQYTSLLQTLLPKYQKFLLWLTLHDSSYFGKGKEEHAALCDRLGIVRVTTSKISSKQIGDEWMNGRKGDNGKVLPNQSTISKANSLDPGKLWPLLCFELSISVDQEDRFIKAHKR